MNDLLLISGIIIFILGIMLIWNWKNRQRRASMAKRQERKQDEGLDFDESHFDNEDNVSLLNDSESSVTEAVENLEDNVSSVPVESSQKIVKEQPPTKKSELIIALFVVTQNEIGFAGTDIFSVLEELGLKYGEMGIFHHYGIGEIKSQQAVFSVANMLEPGTFNPQQASGFNSPGLALFMRLPGPFGGRVAFELMLNNGQRMAEMLEGLLIDEKHASLTQETIIALRNKIANFEQRSPGLAMLKQFSQ